MVCRLDTRFVFSKSNLIITLLGGVPGAGADADWLIDGFNPGKR